jgi:anion-transporting  ArsA/GET3 family ATPase
MVDIQAAGPTPGPTRGPIDELLARRLVLVSGKGGVGRTTLVAALAHLARRGGKRVLVAELAEDGGTNSALARLFGRERLPVVPDEVSPGIQGGVLLSRAGQELFLTSVLHIGTLARAALASEALKRLLQAAPALRELGVFYHLLHHLRRRDDSGNRAYDFIVIDMPATGHTLALTSLPEIVLSLATRGPIPNAMREGLTYVHDPRVCGVYLVTLPETLPVSEALELMDGLKEGSMPVAGLILNRVPPRTFSEEERAALAPLIEGRKILGAHAFHQEEEAKAALARLRTATSLPVLTVPDVPGHGHVLLNALVDLLAEQVRVAA